MTTHHLLAADIGGTNSRFAMFRLSRGSCSDLNTDQNSDRGLCRNPNRNFEPDANLATNLIDPKAESGPVLLSGGWQLSMVPGSKLKLSTPEHGSFGDLLQKLRSINTPGGFSLLDPNFKLGGAAFAVPGPVLGPAPDTVAGSTSNKAMTGSTCRAPNISWPLSTQEAYSTLGLNSFLVNDFAAQGLACLLPAVQGLRQILPGEAKNAAPKIILGAGTGLGKAIILPALDENAPLSSRILPSEGGHSVFAFCGAEEAAFEEFLRRVSGRREVIGDMVVTGYGLAALYAFHVGKQTLLPPPEVTPRLHDCPKALEWLARFYGRACRNLVLETLALGGVLLSGGMLSHVPGLLGHPAFATEFRSSETQARLLAQVPVCWVSNQDSGLWGAALYGLEQLHLEQLGCAR